MMREKLGHMRGTRGAFTGIFVRTGTKRGWRGNIDLTLLLKDINDENGEPICKHLWFNHTKGFRDMEKEQGDMEEGDVISFSARVKKYKKGYFGRRWDVYKTIETDYKLSHPTKIRKLQKMIVGEQVECTEKYPDKYAHIEQEEKPVEK